MFLDELGTDHPYSERYLQCRFGNGSDSQRLAGACTGYHTEAYTSSCELTDLLSVFTLQDCFYLRVARALYRFARSSGGSNDDESTSEWFCSTERLRIRRKKVVADVVPSGHRGQSPRQIPISLAVWTASQSSGT